MPIKRIVDKMTVVIASVFFRRSSRYWNFRYWLRGTSGAGSYGEFAEAKAEWLNRFFRENEVEQVVDHGCGDGSQAALLRVPKYIGLDVSCHAVDMCKARFASDPGRLFYTYSQLDEIPSGDVALSLDVIYHLVEDDVFEEYMVSLFRSAGAFAIIYSSDYEQFGGYRHVRHRHVSRYCAEKFPEFELTIGTREDLSKGLAASFLIYTRKQGRD